MEKETSAEVSWFFLDKNLITPTQWLSIRDRKVRLR
jgi:hypothetical protein